MPTPIRQCEPLAHLTPVFMAKGPLWGEAPLSLLLEPLQVATTTGNLSANTSVVIACVYMLHIPIAPMIAVCHFIQLISLHISSLALITSYTRSNIYYCLSRVSIATLLACLLFPLRGTILCLHLLCSAILRYCIATSSLYNGLPFLDEADCACSLCCLVGCSAITNICSSKNVCLSTITQPHHTLYGLYISPIQGD